VIGTSEKEGKARETTENPSKVQPDKSGKVWKRSKMEAPRICVHYDAFVFTEHEEIAWNMCK
jgi:hypothetical protein